MVRRIQPGAQRRFAAESSQFPVRLEKHFLQQIFRVIGRAGHAQHQAEKAPRVLAIQFLERIGISGPAPRRQLEVGGSQSPGCLDGMPGCQSCRLTRAASRNGTLLV